MLRLKMQVGSVKRAVGVNGEVSQEEVALFAVYGAEGSVNAQWSKYTPCGQLTMTISNPDAFGCVCPGMFVFVDITETTKEAT